MTKMILKAHFDGKTITLDEPCNLRPGTPVTVTASQSPLDLEKSDWEQIACESLAQAYSGDEPEYTLKDIKP